MYNIRSNDGDLYKNFPDIEETVSFLKHLLEIAAREEDTKKHNTYEVYYTE